MKILSTNISQPRTVQWRGREVTTGIFKEPIDGSIRLGLTDVVGDHVIDRRYHGGVDKAFYIYGDNHYPFFKELYPDLEWGFGMFGENLTVDSCIEEEIMIGSIYEVGKASVQVVQPRQPCFKLGIKFNDQGVLKKFIQSEYSGVYFKVLEEGEVTVGDAFYLVERDEQGVSVRDLFVSLYNGFSSDEKKDAILNHETIPSDLRKFLAGKA